MVCAQWRALYTKITEVDLSAFVYRLFHEDFSPILGKNYVIINYVIILNITKFMLST